MSSNQPIIDTLYMEPFVQGEPGCHNSWYDYGASFNNVMIPVTTQGEAQLSFEQNSALEQAQRDRSRALQRNTKRSTASADRCYYCKECGASFANSSNLKSHGRIHSGERPYVCDICNASFVQSSNMKAHKRTHTGERPYSCTECGQTFSRSSHLTGHKRTHTGERPYICGVCHDAFVTSTHLRNHMRKHTGERPFICKICQLGFAQNSSLKIHLRVHTGERPYKCASCTLAFRSNGDLRSHHKLHTESRPYMCIECNKTFKTRQYLQKHVKKCGAPPTGKKRGRPKKVIAAVSETVDTKCDNMEPFIINCNKSTSSEIQIINCHSPKNNRSHHKLRTNSLDQDFKMAEFEREINSGDISANSKCATSAENKVHRYTVINEKNTKHSMFNHTIDASKTNAAIALNRCETSVENNIPVQRFTVINDKNTKQSVHLSSSTDASKTNAALGFSSFNNSSDMSHPLNFQN